MAVMKQIATAADLYPQEPPTATSLTGAPSHTGNEWHDINWRKVNQNVRRLQARIVKATQAGRWGKVKALQRLLTRSFNGKALAVRRVTENQGKRTAGVDGEIWSTPAAKAQAIQSLRQHGYQAQPLRRVYIPKKKGKRPLSIPTMRDRAMQALYKLALDPIAETTGDPNSYGFRKERSTADAIGQCFTVLSRKNSAQWVLEGDIKSCFDEISHQWLEKQIPIEKQILRQWLKAGYVDKGILYPTDEGCPQGGIISPVLSNMTLDGLEAALRQRFPRRNRKGPSAKVNLVRYADDFIVTGRSKELLENEVKPLIEEFLSERGLTLSEAKTHITHMETGFDFLGQTIRKYKGKPLVKPSHESVTTFLHKVRTIIKTNKQATAGDLVQKLNPILKGWALYHCHVVSKQTYVRMDHEIFQALWQWACRRHPKQRKEWVRQKYFTGSKQRKWAFFGTVQDKEGKTRKVQLGHLAKTAIKRHVKVKAEANPYDPQWETYFEQRIDAKMKDDLKGKGDLLYLWQKQHGVCPICNQKITKQTGWHSHHIVWRVHGGSDGLENRVLLHPNCHQQVHSRGLKVEKPRLATSVRKA